MVLSKREQIILIVTLACVGLLVVNSFIITPVQTRLDNMEVERARLEGQIGEAKSLMDFRRDNRAKWRKLMSDGLQSASAVESRVSSALTDWSGRTGLSVSSIKPDRGISEKGLQEMIFTVAGEGSLEAVAQFLWEIETATLPVKIKHVQIGSSSDAGQNMTLQLHVSALYLGAQSVQPQQKASEAKNEEDI